MGLIGNIFRLISCMSSISRHVEALLLFANHYFIKSRYMTDWTLKFINISDSYWITFNQKRLQLKPHLVWKGHVKEDYNNIQHWP